MKTSKIKTIGSTITPYEHENGITYYRDVSLENGDSGSLGSKEESPSWLKVGEELSYELNGNRMKRKTDFKPGKKSGGGKPFTPKKEVNPDVQFPVPLDKMVFVHIETSPNGTLKENPLFEKAHSFYSRRFEGVVIQDAFENDAAIIPEFSKIEEITIGWVKEDSGSYSLSHLSKPLVEARDLLDKFYNNGFWVVGYGLRNFIVPTLSKHCVKNGLRPPKFSPVAGQKPWDLKLIDISEYYQFGDNYGLGSFEFLCSSAGLKQVPTYEETKKSSKFAEHSLLRLQATYDFVKYINELK